MCSETASVAASCGCPPPSTFGGIGDECLDSDNGKKNGKGNCNGSITLYQASLNCNVAAGFLFATFATNAEQNYQKTTASKILMKRKEKGEREIGEKDNEKGEIRVQAN